MAASKVITHVREDKGLFIACDTCEFGLVVTIGELRSVFGDMDAGRALLQAVWHVEHEHNGMPAEALR